MTKKAPWRILVLIGILTVTILSGLVIDCLASAFSIIAMVAPGNNTQTVNVLLFTKTKTEGFRHDIIEYGSEVIDGLGDNGDFEVTWTEDSNVFTDEGLAGYAAIIFFNTSDDVLDEEPAPAELPVHKDKWWSDSHSIRIPITVGAAGYQRFDVPAEVELDFAKILQNHSGRLDENSLRLVEVNSEGDVLDASVAFQLDRVDPSVHVAGSPGTLVFSVTGMTPAHSARRFYLYLGLDSEGNTGFTPPDFTQQVVVADHIFHRGKDAFKITTRDARGVPNSTYYYHKPGGGFASMYDADGYDWLDYSPAEGDLGEWRGIPQLGWQGHQWERANEDPGFGHPDYNTGQSEIVHQGPLKTTIRAWSDNGDYEMFYEVYPAFVRLIVTRVPDREYWFLYEGSPGGEGELDETDFFVRDDGSYSPLNENWAGELEWGYFTSKARNRSLFLIHEDFRNHDYREASYWQLRTMTVFGFGRGSGENRMTPLLKETPNRFIFGFTDGMDYDWVSKVVNSALHPLSYRIDPPQILESSN